MSKGKEIGAAARCEIDDAIRPGEPQEIAALEQEVARLTLEDFDFGLINAIPREKTALAAVFGKPRKIPQEAGLLSMDYVIVEKADKTQALVAVADVAGMGIAQAAVATAGLKSWLPSMGRVILCGIAAGQPNLEYEEKDVRVGDVVISSSVVQYDHVKRSSANNLEYRGTQLDAPDPRMIGAANNLKSEAERIDRWSWEEVIERGTKNWPEARRPNISDDTNSELRKYKCHFHRRGEDRPHLHIGVIGSANILLKDAKFRDAINKQHKTLAYEMEGAGLAIAAPTLGLRYLLVRGICDYADKKKNDEWQRYAALSAASVAYCILAQL